MPVRTEEKYMHCTLGELAAFIAEGVNSKAPLESKIMQCDFAVCDDDPKLSLEEIYSGVTGWHGVKVMPDLGFDSKDMVLAADYYGGGSLSLCAIWDGMDEISVEPKDMICKMLIECLENTEVAVDEHTEVFVDKRRYVRGTGLPA